MGNSLVGSISSDRVGSGGIKALTTIAGHYLVISPSWNNNQGAVTWGSGAVGVSGATSEQDLECARAGLARLALDAR